MSVFDDMDNLAQVQAHLAHWRDQLADDRRKDDFLFGVQAKGIIATLERKEAELQAAPAKPNWQSGHQGIPTDRPVWAIFFESGSGEDEDVMLLRGVSDEDGEVFTVQHKGDWDRYGHVVCWIDVEERPPFSVEAVDAIVAALANQSGIHWGCADHIVEDWLHREALRAVVDGNRDAPAIAAAALKSREIRFSRYYG
ncbi:hypothetical protein [Methylobacterium platani]|nr:hypothetical protein [Methylobacterium platani]